MVEPAPAPHTAAKLAELVQRWADVRQRDAILWELCGFFDSGTGEGRARAVANGVKLGRKPKLTPHQQNEARQRVAAGNETLREIARSYNVHNSTISRLTA